MKQAGVTRKVNCAQQEVNIQNTIIKFPYFLLLDGTTSDVLRKAELITMSREECNAKLLEWNRLANDDALKDGIGEGQYCAYNPHGKQDSCQGDSGGPVQYFPFKTSAISKVIGIISYGFGCGGDKPGVNTRVAYYMDWIESKVWPNGFTLPR